MLLLSTCCVCSVDASAEFGVDAVEFLTFYAAAFRHSCLLCTWGRLGILILTTKRFIRRQL